MEKTVLTGKCSACNEKKTTFLYHGSNSKKIELCKACYDEYHAKEMIQYWKDHIAEEKLRTGAE